MKPTLLAALSFSVANAAITHQRSTQQDPYNLGPVLAQILPRANVVKVDSLGPQLRENAKRTVARYGPITLVGRGVSIPVDLRKCRC